jgi:hypothetical protein
VLLVDGDAQGWTLRVVPHQGEHLRLDGASVSRDAARGHAQAVARAIGSPRITTALTRVLSRPQVGQAALERVGEALLLPGCGRSRAEIEGDIRFQTLHVDRGRVRGKLAGGAAGPGYAHVADLLEDTVVELLERGRFEAALKQMAAYDVALSVENGGLRCRAPQGMVTAGLKTALAAHKEGLLAHAPAERPEEGLQGKRAPPRGGTPPAK